MGEQRLAGDEKQRPPRGRESEHLSDEELGEFRARVATAVRQECAK